MYTHSKTLIIDGAPTRSVNPRRIIERGPGPAEGILNLQKNPKDDIDNQSLSAQTMRK
jgi:hypothetical protein